MARIKLLFAMPLLLSLTLFVGCSGDETGGASAVTSPLDLSYITDDFSSAIIVHPGRALNSDFVKELEKAGVPIEKILQEPIDETGIDPRNVEQVIVLLDKETASMAPGVMGLGGPPGGAPGGFGPPDEFELDVPDGAAPEGGTEPFEEERVPENGELGKLSRPAESIQTVSFQAEGTFGEGDSAFEEGHGPELGPGMGGPPVPTLIVRFTQDVDTATFFDKLNGPPLEDAEVDGLKVKKTPFPEAALHFVDARTLIFTKPSLLKKMVDTKSAESDLIAELKRVDSTHDLIIVADLMPFREQLTQASQMLVFFIPPDKKALGSIPTKTKMLTIAGGVSNDSLMSLTLIMDSADDVTAVNKVLTDSLNEGRDSLDKQQAQGLPPGIPLDDESLKELMAISNDIVAGISNSAEGNRLTINIPKPASFDKLPQIMKPLLEESIGNAQRAAQDAAMRNNLKQIGLAFHNYHDTYRAFPAAGSNAEGNQKGLSWRVHLLPFLEEAPLYEQFNLDEPWDSEHNKALISQMPDVFRTPEVTEEGKTVFHVIVGENAAFQMEKGRKFSEFTDGLSNTIIAVQAGPEKAEIWTKPGGLDFSVEKALSEIIGDVGDAFPFLRADGSVDNSLSIGDPEIIKAMMTINGAEPVN